MICKEYLVIGHNVRTMGRYGSGRAQAHARSMVSSILNRCLACSAWGTFAGITTIWPEVAFTFSPPMVSSASPSSTCTTASKGAECSLSPWPASKANRVMVPALFSIRVRLTTESVEYSIESARPMGFDAGMLVLGSRLMSFM